MSEVADRQAKVTERFQKLLTWEDRYKLLIEGGKKLAVYPEEFRSDDLKVRGCQSQVWLHANLDQGRIQFQADSDALIVKGLVALLVEVYSNSTPDDILSASVDFIKVLGFESNLSPSRANGLYAMIKQIYYYATAFRALARTRE